MQMVRLRTPAQCRYFGDARAYLAACIRVSGLTGTT